MGASEAERALRNRLDGEKSKSQVPSPVRVIFFAFDPEFGAPVPQRWWRMFLLRTDQVVDDTGKFVGHRRDCRWRAEAYFPPAEVISEVSLAAVQSLCGESQSESGAVFRRAGLGRQHLSATDSRFWTESQPVTESRSCWKSGQTWDAEDQPVAAAPQKGQ